MANTVVLLNPPNILLSGYNREGRCTQPVVSYQYHLVPISLLYAGTLLQKHGFQVKVIDAPASGLSLTQVFDLLGTKNYLAIIFSISTPSYSDDLNVIKEFKSKFPNTHLSAIGVHVTAKPTQTLQDSLLDSVVLGEPEMTILDLCISLNNGNEPNNV